MVGRGTLGKTVSGTDLGRPDEGLVAAIRGIGSRHALCGAQPALMVRGSPAQEVQFQTPIQPRARVGTVRKRQKSRGEYLCVVPKSLGGLLPPSPPAEKASACQDQARQARTGDGTRDSNAGNKRIRSCPEGKCRTGNCRRGCDA
jgi:hypothetical protein